jgi:hypothetical protein
MGSRITPDVTRESASELLSRKGVQYRVSRKGGVTWFNMKKCPACGHEGYQCGISESVGAGGRLIHGVKCFHVADNGFGTSTPKYEDFLLALGEITAEDVRRIKTHAPRSQRDGTSPTRSNNPNSGEARAERVRLPNPEFFAALRKRLHENENALGYLSARGLTVETIERFGLGLSKPYEKSSGEVQENALVFPMIGSDGRFYNKYGYYNIPEVTTHPTDRNGWMSGEVRTYYADAADEKRSIFVCEGAKDVWRQWQALGGVESDHDILLVTSTHGSAFPREWKEQGFWERWQTVYFGHDNDDAGDRMASDLVKLIGREARRVSVPKRYGKDWTDFWQAGASLQEFEELLSTSPVVSQKLEPADADGGVGRFSYSPVDINGAFHNGYLYHTVQTLRREQEVFNLCGSNSPQLAALRCVGEPVHP